MDDPQLTALRSELQSDPESIGYGASAAAARAAFPDDSGVQDVAVADLINASTRAATIGEAPPQIVIAAFAAEEWAASKALIPTDATVGQIFDRLMVSTTITVGGEAFNGAIGLLVLRGSITADRGEAIKAALLAGFPQISRAAELGFPAVTPSDVANARRLDPPIELGA